MVNKKLQIFVIGFLLVTMTVGPLSAQTPAPVGPQGTCGVREQGYGRSKNPGVIFGEPYTVPQLRLRITDKQTGVPIGEREVIIRYVWRWFEYPYQEHPRGVWSDAYDLVKCTTDKDGFVSMSEFAVTPSGWYKGEKLKGRKPEFTHLDVSVHLETHITHVRVTKDELERFRRSKADSIPLQVSLASRLSAGPLRQSEVMNEEYAVYSAVIAQMFAGGKVTFDTQAKIKTLVIKDHTVSNSMSDNVESEDGKYLREKFPSLSKEAVNDFVAKNKKPQQLIDAFSIELNHTMIRKDEIDQIFKGGRGSWEEFYKRFPDSGGAVGISRPGFNREVNQALMYLEHGCGGLCGTGQYLLLEKRDGKWKVVDRLLAWIS